MPHNEERFCLSENNSKQKQQEQEKQHLIIGVFYGKEIKEFI